MKLGLVFAIASLAGATIGPSAAGAVEPASVAGVWKPQKLEGVLAMQSLQFTGDGQVFALSPVMNFTRAPGAKGPVVRPLTKAFVGQYQARGDKVIVRLDSRTSTTFELTKAGLLCIYPGPALMNGEVRRQPGERQCYERQGERS